MKLDKQRLRDDQGRPLTQSLFLEIGYDTDRAIYTLKDDDYNYKGTTYPSLKRLYLEMEDVIEYDFAKEYLLGWQHWQRLNRNKTLSKYFQEWREELELAIRSQQVRTIIDMTATEGSFQASKWLADRGWDKKAVGRPSKTDKLREERIKSKIDEEFSADVVRLLRD